MEKKMKKFSKFVAEAGQPEIPNETGFARNPSNGYLTPDVLNVSYEMTETNQFKIRAKIS